MQGLNSILYAPMPSTPYTEPPCQYIKIIIVWKYKEQYENQNKIQTDFTFLKKFNIIFFLLVWKGGMGFNPWVRLLVTNNACYAHFCCNKHSSIQWFIWVHCENQLKNIARLCTHAWTCHQWKCSIFCHSKELIMLHLCIVSQFLQDIFHVGSCSAGFYSMLSIKFLLKFGTLVVAVLPVLMTGQL